MMGTLYSEIASVRHRRVFVRRQSGRPRDISSSAMPARHTAEILTNLAACRLHIERIHER
jgi:hypothetical protein